jgi:uncharacterized surface protein with fasciclin (FAS1) repeats
MRVFKNALMVMALALGVTDLAKAESMDKDIVEVAASAGSFKTLIAAAQAAGLVEALKGQGPLTVFAPTDEAFAKLPAGTVENLLKPENKDKLTAVLTYHVVPGRVTAGEVVNLSSAKTINGRALQISSMDGKVMIDNARVTATDIMASNGIIHVIDSVVLRKRGYFFGGEPRLDVFRLRFFCCYGKSISVIENLLQQANPDKNTCAPLS